MKEEKNRIEKGSPSFASQATEARETGKEWRYRTFIPLPYLGREAGPSPCMFLT